MKKRTKKMFLFFTLAMCLITAIVPMTAYAAGMTYDKDNKCISGAFDTSGSEGITRIEIYVPNGFQYQDDNILLNDISSGTLYHLNGDLVTNQGTDANTEVRYGGIVPINDYQMNCIIYYIVSASDVSWELKINMADSLSECFVAKSKVPTNWETPYDAVITEPINLIQYFIDSNVSNFKSMDDVTALLNTQVQESAVDDSTFSGEVVEDEKKDPVVTLLIFMMGAVIFAIIVTIYFLKKESAKKEALRSERYVAKENEKVKREKIRETDELSELISSYDDEYVDEECEEKKKETNGDGSECVQQIERQPRIMPEYEGAQSGEPGKNPVQPNPYDSQGISQNSRPVHELNAPVPDMAFEQPISHVMENDMRMASPQGAPAPMPYIQRDAVQTYQPAMTNNQFYSQSQYLADGSHAQVEFGRSIQQQETPLPMGPQQQGQINQQQFGYQQNPNYNALTSQQQNYQHYQRVDQQATSAPQKKIPAFARKQG